MAIGDVTRVTADGVSDLYYVDTGMYDVAGYGSVYVIDAERPALVDTGIGTDRDRVRAAVRAAGLELADIEVIVVTHVHLDHAGGVGFLVENCPSATVFVHERGAPHLVDPERLWQGTKAAVGDQITHYTEPRPVPADRITELVDGDRVELGDHTLAVVHVPGHAPHQVAFYDPASGVVFPGDAAGIYAPERDRLFPTSPPPSFDPEACRADVERLQALDPAVLCYTHFGAVPAGDRLGRYADVLSSWVETVRAGAERHDWDREAVVDDLVAGADAERELWGSEKADAEVAMNVRGVLGALAD